MKDIEPSCIDLQDLESLLGKTENKKTVDELIDESINEIKSFAKLHQVEINFVLEDSIEFKGFPNLLKIALKNVKTNK